MWFPNSAAGRGSSLSIVRLGRSVATDDDTIWAPWLALHKQS